MKIEEIVEELKDRRLYRVASVTGLSYQTLRNIVTGKNRNPTMDTVNALEAYLKKEQNGQPNTVPL